MGKGWKAAGKQEKALEKGKIFTKLAREIAVATKLGGPDPEANARLKLAIATAKEHSCPKDTIERAIKKGSGQLEGQVIEELTYEGYGPHGVGVIVECQTDNKNRTVSELRTIFKSSGGALGESGSVAWMFQRVALIIGKNAKAKDPEGDAIEVGANDVSKEDDGSFSFIGGVDDLETMRGGLLERGWEITTAEVSYHASQPTALNGEQMQEVVALLEELEDFDDTSRVHATIN